METKDHQSKILCDDYIELNNIFNKEDWSLRTNELNKITYTSRHNEFEEFTISVLDNKIEVSIPMPNSEVLYRTTLYSNTEVIEYLQKHLDNLNDNNSIDDNSDNE
tara:strand:- start:611 stop:928 length:318 start_codon:yes stop_codon:yes gene_type:complete